MRDRSSLLPNPSVTLVIRQGQVDTPSEGMDVQQGGLGRRIRCERCSSGVVAAVFSGPVGEPLLLAFVAFDERREGVLIVSVWILPDSSQVDIV